jgi:HPt (histidine-containing phosphotransfer) domain-containing protein
VKPISHASLAAVLAAATSPGEGDAAGSDDPPLLDRAQVEDMCRMLGSERTGRQIALFLREAEEMIAGIAGIAASAGAPGDAAALRRSVHRLAGSAAVLGAGALQAHLQTVEAALAEDDGRFDMEALRAVWAETEAAFRGFQSESEPSERV